MHAPTSSPGGQDLEKGSRKEADGCSPQKASTGPATTRHTYSVRPRAAPQQAGHRQVNLHVGLYTPRGTPEGVSWEKGPLHTHTHTHTHTRTHVHAHTSQRSRREAGAVLPGGCIGGWQVGQQHVLGTLHLRDCFIFLLHTQKPVRAPRNSVIRRTTMITNKCRDLSSGDMDA